MGKIGITYKGANQISLSAGPRDLVRLNPGLNQVDSDTWERIVAAAKKEAKDSKSKTRGGVLYFMDNDMIEEAPIAADGSAEITEMNAKTAISVVEAEVDLDNLNNMLADENGGKARQSVIKAIEKQITAIEEAIASGNE